MNNHDSGPLRVLGISGSLRRSSSNTGLLLASQEVAPKRMEVSILDIGNLPFFNLDL